jgi:DNA-binding CsgD family transcriptional regulator/tetratricopeptide (TPR) repeat protein
VPLLERDPALAQLAAAHSSGGRLLLLAGEAGVGKTALLRHFCDGRDDVLWGDCDALFTPSQLGPLTDIAEVTGGDLAAAVADAAPAHVVTAAFLRELEQRGSAIVVVEDVHWADEATLDVLRLLGRRIATVPVLLIATYRDDELDRSHPLRVMLGELSRRDTTSRLRLEPLSLEAVAELAEPFGVDAAELHRRTAGNPFFVTEALAAGGVELPATVRDAVLARVKPLSPAARHVLDAAAIVPGPVEPALLETLAGDAIAQLEECLSCGVLGSTPAGVAFRHDLAHMAIEEALLPHERLELHRRALDALSGRADPARLAYHAEGAGDGEAVLRHAPAAAERASAAGAHREAAAQYARALRFAGHLDPAERARLLERRSHECYTADMPGEAAADLQRALSCYREIGDRRGEGDMLRALSVTLWCPRLPDDADRAGRDAVAILEPLGPSRELANAYANMASLGMNNEDAEETYAWGERAIELARRFGDKAIELNALNSVGTMEFLAGGPAARGTGERSLAMAQETGDVEGVLRAYSNLAWAALRHRDYPLAERYLDAAAAASASDPELDLWWIHLLGYRARIELDLGRWAEAAETAATILRAQLVSPLPPVVALSVIGRLRARRGDPQPWAPLDEGLELAGPELQRYEAIVLARAEAAYLGGDRERVIAETDRLLELARRRDAGWVVGELACWRRRAGLEEDVPDVPDPFAFELAGEYERAAAAWTALGCPYEAAVALAGAGDEATLRRAFADLSALGATAAATAVGRRLRERGVLNVPRGPRPATRENPAQLTSRELEVLALVADGLRNADIAERLFLSPKTVAHHVSAILRKLGARSRGEAGALAGQLGLR